MRSILAAASAALVTAATVAVTATPASAATTSAAACQRAATAKAVAAARADLRGQVSTDGQILGFLTQILDFNALDRSQSEAYAATIRPLSKLMHTTYSVASVNKLTTVSAIRARAAAFRPVDTEIGDVDLALLLALAASGGIQDMTTVTAQKEIVQARSQLSAVADGMNKTATGNALDRLSPDAVAYTTILEPGFAKLAHSSFSRHASVTAQTRSLLSLLTNSSAVMRFSDDIDVIATVLPNSDLGQSGGGWAFGGGGALAMHRSTPLEAARTVLAHTRTTASNGSAVFATSAAFAQSAAVPTAASSGAPTTTCGRIALAAAKSSLDDTIDTAMDRFTAQSDYLRWSGVPAAQYAAYQHAVSSQKHLRATTFSRAAVARLTSTSKVAALAKRWHKSDRLRSDIVAAMQTAGDYSGGHADPKDYAPYFAALRAVLADKESLGLDESVADAALSRIPADMAALTATAEPVFGRLATVDFTRHSEVNARRRAAAAAASDSPAAVALDNDGEVVDAAAFSAGYSAYAATGTAEILHTRD